MELEIYLVKTICLAAVLTFFMLFKKGHDYGFLILAFFCGTTTILSFCLVSWLPIAIGTIVMFMLLFVGAGKWVQHG